jgi:predicted TIM-barrel fold metal-dependent hydrolase
MSDLIITDSQVHVWKPDTPDRPWPEGTHSFAHGPSMTPEQMIAKMDEAGVSRAMLVPPSWEGDRNDYAAESAAKYPDRFVVAGRVPLQTRLEPEELRAVCERFNLKGLRFTFARGASLNWMTDGTADWLWSAAQEINMPVFIYAPSLTEQIDRVLTDYPGLRLTLDHFALNTVWRDDELDEPIRQAISLARHPNLSVKASSLPSYVTDPYPFRSLHPRLRAVVEAYGPERVFWGSDVSRLTSTYRECVTYMSEALEFLDDKDFALVMGGAFSALVDWPA